MSLMRSTLGPASEDFSQPVSRPLTLPSVPFPFPWFSAERFLSKSFVYRQNGMTRAVDLRVGDLSRVSGKMRPGWWCASLEVSKLCCWLPGELSRAGRVFGRVSELHCFRGARMRNCGRCEAVYESPRCRDMRPHVPFSVQELCAAFY